MAKYEYIEHGTVDLKIPRHTVIKRLRSLEGLARGEHTNRNRILLACDPEGHVTMGICVETTGGYMMTKASYAVHAELLENTPGVTTVRIFSSHRQVNSLVRKIIRLVGFAFSLIIYALLIYLYQFPIILAVPAFAFTAILLYVTTVHRKGEIEGSKDTYIDLMIDELKSKLEAVKRWND